MDNYILINDLAKILNITHSAVYWYINREQLETERVLNRVVVVLDDDTKAFIANFKKKSKGGKRRK